MSASGGPRDRLPVVAMVGGGQLARMTHQAAIPLGQSLRGPIRAITDWAESHVAEVLAAREDYDEAR